jgi:hypothetical protein
MNAPDDTNSKLGKDPYIELEPALDRVLGVFGEPVGRLIGPDTPSFVGLLLKKLITL